MSAPQTASWEGVVGPLGMTGQGERLTHGASGFTIIIIPWGGVASLVLRAIAIDGPAGAGKTVIAQQVARALRFRPLYTGLMYRALTWAFLSRGIPLEDCHRMGEEAAAYRLRVDMENGEPRVVLDDQDVTPYLRLPEVDRGVSLVAACPKVREVLVALQRRLAEEGQVVVEGRDATTVIAPDACLKVFLTATRKERARRRWEAETRATYDEVLADLVRRDLADARRESGPLQVHPDAVVLDTTDLSPEEVVTMVVRLYGERCEP